MGWLVAMQSSGMRPDARSYNSVAYACAKDGRVEEAGRWLAAMQASGLTPDDRSYITVIHACAKDGQVDDAIKWLAAMQCDVTPYNIVINACAKHGRVEDATKWFAAMQDNAVTADVVSYTSMISACAKAKPANMRVCQQMVSSLVEDGIVPNAYTLLAPAMLKCCANVRPREVDLAVHWFQAYAPSLHVNEHVQRALASTQYKAKSRHRCVLLPRVGVSASVGGCPRALGSTRGTWQQDCATEHAFSFILGSKPRTPSPCTRDLALSDTILPFVCGRVDMATASGNCFPNDSVSTHCQFDPSWASSTPCLASAPALSATFGDVLV